MGFTTSYPGQSWTSDTANVLNIEYTNDTSSAVVINSITCQLGSGKGTVKNKSPDVDITGTGGEFFAVIKVNNTILARALVSKSVEGVYLDPEADSGYFYNIGGNSAYNITFNFSYRVEVNSKVTFTIHKETKSENVTNATIITSRYFENQVITGDVGPVGPNSIYIWYRDYNTKVSDVYLTDNSDQLINGDAITHPNPSKGIYYGSYAVIPDYQNYENAYWNLYLRSNDGSAITSVTVSDNMPRNIVNVNIENSDYGWRLTFYAVNTYTDYPFLYDYQQPTITVNGGASTKLNLHFIEKIKTHTVQDANIVLKINISSILYSTNKYTFNLLDDGSFNEQQTNNAKGQKLVLVAQDETFNDNIDKIDKVRDFSIVNNRLAITVGDLFTLDSDTGLFNLKNENKETSLVWRFYNSQARAYNCVAIDPNHSSYIKDITTKVQYSITPNFSSQLSYVWYNSQGSVVTDIPDTILLSQFYIGDIKYDNTNPEGGYCRGFRLTFIDNSTGYTNTFYLEDVSETQQKTSYKGNVFNLIQNSLDVGVYTLKIASYFYFNNDSNNRHKGAEITIPQKIVFLTDEDMLPTLVFPLYSENEPYTSMLLYTERIGYEFSDAFVESLDELNVKFGVTCNNIDIDLLKDNSYFSSNKITKHLVFDVGTLTKENKYDTVLYVQPYIDVYDTNNVKIKRIQLTSNYENKKVNCIISVRYFWDKPLNIKQGKLIKASDLNNQISQLKIYLYKYNALYDGSKTILSNFTFKSGDIINTEQWLALTDVIQNYAHAMQNWVTDITNKDVLWATPEFMHKAGEIVTVDNLLQNPYDLLDQFNTIYATYEYLTQYTHNYLSGFTYEQIKTKKGI